MATPSTKFKRIPNPPSKGEETLAVHLRAHKIAFTREYAFHPIRRWKIDFALLNAKLAIEVEQAA